MDANSSISSGNKTAARKVTVHVTLVQVFVALFLCINLIQILTFFNKELFYRTMRYILFANMLIADCVILIVTNVLMIFSLFSVPVHMSLCIFVYMLSSHCKFVTPITLTTMTLERYVAICMPLRHSQLCSTRSALRCLLVIHVLSVVPFVTLMLIFFTSSSTAGLTASSRICRAEVFLLHDWHSHFKFAISQIYFLFMCVSIVFSYAQIMRVARAACGDDRTSSRRGLRTVLLHSLQLLLCLIQLWCPIIETAVRRLDMAVYIHLRFINYIVVYLASRCLSPLIYGLRDEKFFLALTQFVLCGFCKKNS